MRLVGRGRDFCDLLGYGSRYVCAGCLDSAGVGNDPIYCLSDALIFGIGEHQGTHEQGHNLSEVAKLVLGVAGIGSFALDGLVEFNLRLCAGFDEQLAILVAKGTGTDGVASAAGQQ